MNRDRAAGQNRGMILTERDQIRFGDAVIDFEVRRSTRRHKTLQLSVGPEGVCVAVPAATPPDEIHGFVRKKARWIMDRLAAARAVPCPSEMPSSLPFLGRDLSVVVGNGVVPDVDVRFRPWELQVFLPLEMSEDEAAHNIRDAIREWYWLRAFEHVSTSVERWWPELGRGAKSEVLIGDQRKRWGSCAADGALRFNWRLVMLEPRLLDYVVVHELAHLTERNHGPAFWELVAEVLPDAAERKAALHSVEGKLPL